MSQQQLHLSAAVRQAIEDIQEEIYFQNVLLASIDHSVQNRETAEREVKDEINALEKKVLRLKRGATSAASSSSASYQPQGRATAFSHSNPSGSFTFTKTNSTAAMDSSLGRQQWNPNTSYSSTGSTPNSGNSSDLLSPSPITLPRRKRSYSKHLDNALPSFEDNKSRRTSPSPYLTGPTTPSSIISSGDDDFPDFGSQRFAQKQREIEERIKQEKRDEELARSIQQEFQSTPMRLSTVAEPSAFDIISGVRRPQSASGKVSGSVQLPLSHSGKIPPWPSTSSKAPIMFESSLNAPNFKREELAFQNPDQRVFKTERSLARPMPGAFSNDLSDSNDSDIEIIPASAFRDNGRHSRQPIRPSFSSEAQAAGQAALKRVNQPQPDINNALQSVLFGRSNQVPVWMNATNSSYSPSESMHGNNYGNGNSLNSTMGVSQVYPGMLPNSSPSNGFTGYNQFNNGAGMYHNGHSSGSLSGTGGFTVNSTTMNNLSNPLLAGIGRRAGTEDFDDFGDYTNSGESSIGQFDYVMNDPRKTTQEIKDLLENIRPDIELPPEDREGTPEGLVHPLFEHQKLALTWLKSMEESSSKGGILADDMGLGKTISTLALMLSRPSPDRNRKTTLIVGPVALIRQWKDELENKIIRKYSLSIHMVHGPGKKLSWDELKHYDVILTTYGTLSSEWRRYEKWMAQQEENANGGEYDSGPCNKLFPLLGPKSLFYRVVLDEAQSIKNRTTVSAQSCCRLKATYRLCLSGTPMMNSVSELYSLIHFLRIRPYNDYKRFQNEFGMLTKGNYSKKHVDSAMRKFQVMLKAILLRRTKTSLIDGKPIINLPPKTEEVQHVVFDEDEQAFYSALESKSQIQFNKYVKNGTAGKNYSNILVLLLRLRQACCHPHLLHDFQESPTNDDPSSEGMMELARNLSPDVVARLLAQEAFECPVCYDAVLNPRIITPCGHDTCAECLTKISDQAAQQNLRDGNDDNRGLKCPSCRGNLALSKVIDYTAFKMVHNPDPADEDRSTQDSSDDETGSESEDNTDSDGDIRDFIVPDDVDSEDDSTEGDDGDDEAEESKKSKSTGKKPEKRRKSNIGGNRKEKKPHLSLAMLKKEANKNAKNRKRYLKYLEKHWQPSAKITKCVDLLDTFLRDGQKTIIFSQFVSLLDLLEVPINEKNWKCLRYDGSKSADARNEAVRKFKFSSTHNIMLISLKAGNAGLNLTAATRVIILDPFWNPFIEMQAVDRAYRMGQQNPVQVHRILIERTVEDRIIELQEKKRQLVNAALDEGVNKDIGRLDLGQLAFLFGVGQ